MMRIENVTAQYQTITGPVVSVKDVDFTIRDDEIFGIAGESGCGKSTLLKVLYDVIQFPLEIAGGRVVLDYTDATGAHRTLQSRGNQKRLVGRDFLYSAGGHERAEPGLPD